MNNTLNTTINLKNDATFIVTGDIPVMWFRDSVCLVRPYLRFAKNNDELQQMLVGLVNLQMQLIHKDPYVIAFNETENGAGH